MNQYSLTIAEATWLCKALAPDRVARLAGSVRAQRRSGGSVATSPVLRKALLAHYNGDAVLVTTDAHRIHLLRLETATEPFPSRLVDISRVVAAARFARADTIEIIGDEVHTTRRGGDRNRVYGPVIDDSVAGFPDFARVIPPDDQPPSELFAIDHRYLIDATALAGRGGVALSSGGRNENLLIRPREANWRWRAVLAPKVWGTVVRLNDSGEFEEVAE